MTQDACLVGRVRGGVAESQGNSRRFVPETALTTMQMGSPLAIATKAKEKNLRSVLMFALHNFRKVHSALDSSLFASHPPYLASFRLALLMPVKGALDVAALSPLVCPVRSRLCAI